MDTRIDNLFPLLYVAASTNAALIDGHHYAIGTIASVLLAASTNAALIDGHRSGKVASQPDTPAASTNAALIDGHLIIVVPHDPAQRAASTNAALIDGHRSGRLSLSFRHGRIDQRGTDRWTLLSERKDVESLKPPHRPTRH